VLHHPAHGEKFADNLNRELPRMPFAPDFRAFPAAGKELARLHLDYEKLEPYWLKWLEAPVVPLSYRGEDGLGSLWRIGNSIIVEVSAKPSSTEPRQCRDRSRKSR